MQKKDIVFTEQNLFEMHKLENDVKMIDEKLKVLQQIAVTKRRMIKCKI